MPLSQYPASQKHSAGESGAHCHRILQSRDALNENTEGLPQDAKNSGNTQKQKGQIMPLFHCMVSAQRLYTEVGFPLQYPSTVPGCHSGAT